MLVLSDECQRVGSNTHPVRVVGYNNEKKEQATKKKSKQRNDDDNSYTVEGIGVDDLSVPCK